MKQFIITTHADHNPLIVALREEGLEVRHVNWKKPLPNLAGCLAFYGNLFDEVKYWPSLIKLKNQLRQCHVPYVFWNRDAPWNTGIKLKNIAALKLIKPVDIYLAHSLQGQSLFGGGGHYFPNAAQPAYYQDTDLNALQDQACYVHDVAYFGSFGNSKDYNARSRAEFLGKLSARLHEEKTGIRFVAIDTSRQPLPLKEQLHLIRSSKINLNIGAMCDLPGNPSWGLPERVFGIPAAGGYLLTERREMLDSTFASPPESFCSLDQCVQKIKSALSDFSALRQHAESTCAQIRQTHTYRHRARQFIKIVEAFQKSQSIK